MVFTAFSEVRSGAFEDESQDRRVSHSPERSSTAKARYGTVHRSDPQVHGDGNADRAASMGIDRPH